MFRLPSLRMAFVIIHFRMRFLPLQMTRPARLCRAGLANRVLNIGQRELTYQGVQFDVQKLNILILKFMFVIVALKAQKRIAQGKA